MEKCPKCGRYTIAYDGYRRVHRCMVDGCSCIVLDEESYSCLKQDSATGTVNRVRIVDGVEKDVLKKYQLR